MKIIGTGLSGLVGSRIVELLSDKHEFISFSLDSGVDITNISLLKEKFLENKEAEAILHLAAFTDVSSAWEQDNDKNGTCYKVNVLGTKNIAQLCSQNKKYLIHISTDFIFDGGKPARRFTCRRHGKAGPPPGGYTELDKPKPIEWYGKTKYLAEKEIEKSGCDYLILRIAFPFKAKPSPKNLEPQVKLDLVRKIKKRLEEGETLHMFSDQIITPTFIDDIANIVVYSIKVKPQGIYHCTGSSHFSPYQIAAKIAQSFNLDKNLIKKASLKEFIKENPNLRPRQQNLSMSNKKLEKDLGIKMLTFDKALEKIKLQLKN